MSVCIVHKKYILTHTLIPYLLTYLLTTPLHSILLLHIDGYGLVGLKIVVEKWKWIRFVFPISK